ncbi:hypothetical protein MAR_013038, partial [Mya arenaria]
GLLTLPNGDVRSATIAKRDHTAIFRRPPKFGGHPDGAIPKAFLSGVTSDIMRMRLTQEADAHCMSVKNFLEKHKYNILIALPDMKCLLLLVFPPKELAPDLAQWSTRLLCSVLRATNCLTVREQDDVIILTKLCKKYFRRKSQCTVGTITKTGTLAKREWFKLCAAVQRLVENIDDKVLMKQVRQFICRVEMETRTTETRRETQCRLEDLIKEMIKDEHPDKKLTKDNLTDEAKQIVKRQLSNVTYSFKKRSHSTSRPRSAVPRLSTVLESDEPRHYGQTTRGIKGRGRPLSAKGRISTEKTNDRSLYDSISKESMKQKLSKTAIHIDTKADTHKPKVLAKRREVKVMRLPTKRITAEDIYTNSVQRRPMSAFIGRKNSLVKNHVTQNGRPSSSKSCIGRTPSRRASIKRGGFEHLKNKSRPVTNRSGFTKTLQSNTHCEKKQINTRTAPSLSRKRPVSALPRLQSGTESRKIGSERTRQPFTDKSKDKDRALARSSSNMFVPSPVCNTEHRTDDLRKRVDKKTLLSSEHADKDKPKTLIAKDLPAGKTDFSDTVVERFGSLLWTKSAPKMDTKTLDKFHSLEDVKDTEDEVNTPDSLEWQMSETPKASISKEFKENIKQIANEVLVHQQVHEAVRNPLLLNKKFVDTLFTFLHENQVTKKFLRSQTTDPQKSWKLPNGTRAQFSFYLAFIFRHIERRESEQVLYLVQKMMNRMQCSHKSSSRPKSSQSTKSLDKNKPTPLQTPDDMGQLKSKHPVRSRSKSPPLTQGSRKIARLREKLLHSRGQGRKNSIAKEMNGNKAKPERPNSGSRSLSPRPSSSENENVWLRSTSIADGRCWKCEQKDTAMSICVNWGNRQLCELLLTYGVPYKEEHLVAAVKANDLETLKHIVEYLQDNLYFDPESKDVKEALYTARKHSMQRIVTFLEKKGVRDNRLHDCQEFLALLLDSLHEQLNFKANPNKETEPSSSKQPIRFENNINNQAIGQSHSEQNSIDKSRNAVTCVSSLTFDNMKETKKPQVQSLSKMEEKPSTSQCKNLLFPFTVNQISEDSNHSTVSEQSSDSDQCSVMKNLKLRSSPVVSQSGECLSSKVMNDCETRDYGVSSSDDACIGREHGLFDDSKDGESEHQFKRVSSLQDMRVPVVAKCAVISKASSEFNLVNKASPYCDNEQGATPMDATDSEPSCSYVDSIDMSVRNCDSSGNTVELPVVLNNAMQNTPVPLLEDIYSKETKTLNTNVLASEYNQERVNTDSEKFAKQDNTDERSELLIDEEDIIQSVSDITTKADGYEHPKVKDVNIRADKKSKSPKGACGGSGPINDEKEECFALNNVKRMKFEGTEKNLQMQEICKLHKKALLCEALKVDKPADRTLAANTD